MVEYDNIDGYKVVKDEESSKYGLLNENNELIIPCEMDDITEYGWDPLGEADSMSYYYACGVIICRKGIDVGLYIPALNKYIEPQFEAVTALYLGEDEETGESFYTLGYKYRDGRCGYIEDEAEMVPCKPEESAFVRNREMKELIWSRMDE